MKRFLGSGLLLGIALAVSGAVAFAQGDVTVTQSPVGGSGVTATATLTAAGNQTIVTVSAQGLTPGSTNENEIHLGTCANTRGIAFTLTSLVAGANGTATTTDTINASLASLQNGDHEMHIHMTNVAGTVLSCGDIPVAAAVVATATPAATAAATSTPAATAAAAATATPAARATATVTASPTALPRTGVPVPPFAPAAAVGLAVLALGALLRRRG